MADTTTDLQAAAPDDEYATASSQRSILVGGVVCVAVVVTLGLVALLGRIGQGDELSACPPGIEDAATPPTDEATDLYVLVDVPSNDAAQARAIGADVVSQAGAMLRRGVQPTLLTDFGHGTPLVVDECLNGRQQLTVQRDNPINQRRTTERVATDLDAVVRSAVRAQTPAARGGPERLLYYAKQNAPQGAVVMLWSDMLANDGSCFDASGLTVSTAIAKAIASRCDDAGVLDVAAGQLVLLGAGASERSIGFEGWAGELATASCEKARACQP